MTIANPTPPPPPVPKTPPPKGECQGDCTCGIEPLAHPKYSFGMLLEPGYLALEHSYNAMRANTHDIRLHDFGTVCGLRVKKHPSPQCANTYAILNPGIALDCCGREIVVPEPLFVPLYDGATSGWCGAAMGTAGSSQQPAPPKAPESESLYICLRYSQCDTDPIPTYVRACGCCSPCEHGDCTPSVTREGYEVLVSSTPPAPWLNPIDVAFCEWLKVKLKGPGSSAQEHAVPKTSLQKVLCDIITQPCADFCVGGNDLLLLATAKFDADGMLKDIDNVKGRRLVIPTGAIFQALTCLTDAEIECCAVASEDGPRVVTSALKTTMSTTELRNLLREGIELQFTEDMDPSSATPTTKTSAGTVKLELLDHSGASQVLSPKLTWDPTNAIIKARSVEKFVDGVTLRITLTGGNKNDPKFAGPALRDKSGQTRLDGSPATGGDTKDESGDGKQGGDFIWTITTTS